ELPPPLLSPSPFTAPALTPGPPLPFVTTTDAEHATFVRLRPEDRGVRKLAPFTATRHLLRNWPGQPAWTDVVERVSDPPAAIRSLRRWAAWSTAPASMW